MSASIIAGSHPGLALLAPAGAARHRSEDPEALGLGEPGPRAPALALVPALAAAVPRDLHLHLGAGAGQDLPHLEQETGLTFIIHLYSVPSTCRASNEGLRKFHNHGDRIEDTIKTLC